jgi:hypothetical protein
MHQIHTVAILMSKPDLKSIHPKTDNPRYDYEYQDCLGKAVVAG